MNVTQNENIASNAALVVGAGLVGLAYLDKVNKAVGALGCVLLGAGAVGVVSMGRQTNEVDTIDPSAAEVAPMNDVNTFWAELRKQDDASWKRDFVRATDPKVRGFISESWYRHRFSFESYPDETIVPLFFKLFGYQRRESYFLLDTQMPDLIVQAKYSVWFDDPPTFDGVDLDRAIQSLNIDETFIADLVNHSAIRRESRSAPECKQLLRDLPDDNHLFRQAAVLSYLYHDDWDLNTFQGMVTANQVDCFSPAAKMHIRKKIGRMSIPSQLATALGQAAPGPLTPYKSKLRSVQS